jgi:hypothetical protein
MEARLAVSSRVLPPHPDERQTASVVCLSVALKIAANRN